MKCDAKAFSKLYEQVYQDLYRYALCLMRDPHEAEDAVSAAVLSAYEHNGSLATFDNTSSFKSWIFTILSNICKKRLKQVAKEGIQQIEDFFPEGQVEGIHEEDVGLAMDVRNAFFILSEEEQMIVGLSVFGGYNSTEIGKILSLKPGTVRVKRSRALEKMQCVLDGRTFYE